ncbi:MAG: FG-GAP repeat protein [Ignavibacteria bacterium]|nr:FG-GAP repeat protein [Ignavibacteria bacterium]
MIIGSTATGSAYIYFGGVSMDTTADVIMTGESFFGNSVSTAGDVNSDGYSDVIIGANGYSSSTGRAYIYFGGASMNNTADVIMTGEATFNYFGNSVSSAGDVNGDGYSDVIVGAGLYSSLTGRAYIYFGGASG